MKRQTVIAEFKHLTDEEANMLLGVLTAVINAVRKGHVSIKSEDPPIDIVAPR